MEQREMMKKVIFPCTSRYPRCGEGSTVVLKDGRILLMYSLFTGTADHDKSEIVAAILDPETGALSDKRVLFSDSHYLNQMSLSLERLNDGSLGFLWLRKLSAYHDVAYFTRSMDDGLTWSEPKVISYVNDAGYVVVNNDRLRQLRSNRLVVPVCVYPGGFETIPSYLELWYSDDWGETWKRSAEVERCANPPLLTPAVPDLPFADLCASPYREQEPGVEECADGTLYYYCRTNLGYMYNSWSQDQGKTFTELTPQLDIISPLSPQSIRLQPGTSRLWCVYNDHTGITFGDVPNWNWRTPLTLAYSDDNGVSWKKYQQIEDNSHNYCYTSMTFVGNKLLLTYYESENREDGSRRNLASLKMQTVDLP